MVENKYDGRKVIIREEMSHYEEMGDVCSSRNDTGFGWGRSEKTLWGPGALMVIDGVSSLE